MSAVVPNVAHQGLASREGNPLRRYRPFPDAVFLPREYSSCRGVFFLRMGAGQDEHVQSGIGIVSVSLRGCVWMPAGRKGSGQGYESKPGPGTGGERDQDRGNSCRTGNGCRASNKASVARAGQGSESAEEQGWPNRSGYGGGGTNRFNQAGAGKGRGDKNCQAGFLEASGGGEGCRQDRSGPAACGSGCAGRDWPDSGRQDSLRSKLPELSRGTWRSIHGDEGKVPEDRGF